jgi:hypothetical protein
MTGSTICIGIPGNMFSAACFCKVNRSLNMPVNKGENSEAACVRTWKNLTAFPVFYNAHANFSDRISFVEAVGPTSRKGKMVFSHGI